jgi:chromosome partitioning protein
MSVALSFVGLKGGQGRSTLAVRLGALLAHAGHRTVVVDLATCGTASLLLGVGTHETGAGALLAGQARPAEVLRPSAVHDKLWVVPSDPILATIERLPAREPARTGLTSLQGKFDFVLLDAPPGATTPAAAALRAASWAVVPCVPDEPGLAGLYPTLQWVQSQRAAQVLGIVITMSEPRIAGMHAAESVLRAAHGRLVLKASIGRDASWRRCDTLTRLFRPHASRGADADLRAVKSELLRVLVRRA